MKISEMGEFKLIESLSKLVGKPRDDAVIMGIGDDAACWRTEDGMLLATTDSLVEGVHFTLKVTTWRELGWKALSVNLSDIAAMGGIPKYAMISLGVPRDTDAENISRLYQGILELAQAFDVDIIGGDTVASPVMMINITLIGVVPGGQDILTRKAAVPGDQVAVTGHLGASSAGLAMLNREIEFNYHIAKALREAHLKPSPRVAEGQALARCGVKACIDLSDGLMGDLEKLCKSSGVGARVFIDHIPCHPATVESFEDAAVTFALTGGEDYELLFTAKASVIEGVREAVSCPVTVIGEVVKGRGIRALDEAGIEVHVGDRGWDHFGRRGR